MHPTMQARQLSFTSPLDLDRYSKQQQVTIGWNVKLEDGTEILELTYPIQVCPSWDSYPERQCGTRRQNVHRHGWQLLCLVHRYAGSSLTVPAGFHRDGYIYIWSSNHTFRGQGESVQKIAPV
jgi:hypothetical protein